MADKVQKFCDWRVTKGRATDACGSRVPSDEPTKFSLDGTSYVMDICDKHKKEWLACNEPAVAIAVPTSTTRNGQAVRRVMKGKRGAFTSKDVREWLAEQGVEVSTTGRIKQEYIEEYKAAHR